VMLLNSSLNILQPAVCVRWLLELKPAAPPRVCVFGQRAGGGISHFLLAVADRSAEEGPSAPGAPVAKRFITFCKARTCAKACAYSHPVLPSSHQV
jgi:hypothetical protein